MTQVSNTTMNINPNPTMNNKVLKMQPTIYESMIC